jgi:site-specific recombinase XerD
MTFCNARWGHDFMQDNTPLVHYSFLGVNASQAMQAYLKDRADDWPALWMGLRGPLTTLGIYRALRRRSEMADIEPGRVHPHAFRKLFATMWTDNGGDSTSLMRVGGWKTSSVLERYILLTGRKKLGKLHRRYSPSDILLEGKE